MIYDRQRCFRIFFAHSEEKSPESLEVHTRIEKYIYRPESTTHRAYAQEEGFIIDSYDGK